MSIGAVTAVQAALPKTLTDPLVERRQGAMKVIREVLSDRYPPEKLSQATLLEEDLGLDSLARTELIIAVETRFNLRTNITDCENIGQIVDHVVRNTAS